MIQDSVHICTKLKTRLTKPDVFLPMGTTQVSTAPLQEIMNTISKDQHLISATYLDSKFKKGLIYFILNIENQSNNVIKSMIKFSSSLERHALQPNNYFKKLTLIPENSYLRSHFLIFPYLM